MRILILAVLMLLGLCMAPPAAALRCSGKIIETGDRKFDVQRKCGPPSYTDAWSGTSYRGFPHAGEVEEWYYNFGPYRLVHILEFRNGRLNRIDTAGYGYSDTEPGQCRPIDITVGMSLLELYLECGPPVHRERRFQYVSREYGPGLFYPDYAKVEEWVYNFGSNQFLRYVKLVSGRVVNVTTGERGY